MAPVVVIGFSVLLAPSPTLSTCFALGFPTWRCTPIGLTLVLPFGIFAACHWSSDHASDKENHRSQNSSPTSTRSTRSARSTKLIYTQSSSPARIGSPNQLVAARNRADHYERLFRNERKKVNRATSRKEDVLRELSELQAQLQESRSSTSHFSATLEARIVCLTRELNTAQTELAAVHKRNAEIVKQKNSLKKRVYRLPDRIEMEAKKRNTQAIKDGGVISEAIRTCVRDLVAANVPVDNVAAVISSVAEAFDITLVGNLTARGVGRIVKEGGVLAELQIVDELQQTNSATLSGDGTSHKHVQFESRHMMLDVPTYDNLGGLKVSGSMVNLWF
ncbi:hypothetical protein B0H14DRAFT_3428199 [Mycena olivaceomarginata]|nr:hypothetical protein B0H14DRAFT_3428199 [Mycena olivaceomarginata]